MVWCQLRVQLSGLDVRPCGLGGGGPWRTQRFPLAPKFLQVAQAQGGDIVGLDGAT